MKLKKAQKDAVLAWIAEGLESDEINKRAAKFKPRFSVSRSQVDWYRKTRGVKLDQIQEEAEVDALKSGYALKEKRVAALQTLADVMMKELTRQEDNRLWTKNAKNIGVEKYEYQEFNRAEVEALRGVLDDIASEVGARVRKTDLTTGGKPLPRSGLSAKELRSLSDDQLKILEAAATIIEHAGADQETPVEN